MIMALEGSDDVTCKDASDDDDGCHHSGDACSGDICGVLVRCQVQLGH